MSAKDLYIFKLDHSNNYCPFLNKEKVEIKYKDIDS